MIRQAISCDICGAEKKQTNHWFVASEQAGELRVSGWSTRIRLRAGTKHLCGQTCLHKLVDEFMARTIAGRAVSSLAGSPAMDSTHPPESRATDASLTSKAAYSSIPTGAEPHPVAIPKPAPVEPIRPVLAPSALVVPMQPRPLGDQARPATSAPRVEDVPNYMSRRWHAEAWERERERELHATDRRAENSSRRRKAF